MMIDTSNNMNYKDASPTKQPPIKQRRTAPGLRAPKVEKVHLAANPTLPVGGWPAVMMFAGALLLLNLYVGASTQLLAGQTGQVFADGVRLAVVASFALSALLGAATGGGGAMEFTRVRRLWWLSSALLLAARPALRAAVSAFLTTTGGNASSSNAALMLRFAAVAATTLPALLPLGRLAAWHPEHGASRHRAAAALRFIAVLLPPVVAIPKPTCAAPSVAAMAAAAVACLLSSTGRHAPLKSWLGFALVTLAAAAQMSRCMRCGPLKPAAGAIGSMRVLWSCELRRGGRLSVVEGRQGTLGYRVMRLDHAVMGGRWVEPADIAGQSVYSAFLVQQVAWLLRPGGARSLHVGLGVGTAVEGMQRRGVMADVVELHGEVIQVAADYFDLVAHGRALPQDAVAAVAALQPHTYEYVILDVFAGGTAAPRLSSHAFYDQLKGLLGNDGVLAVNYVGRNDAGLEAAACTLRRSFSGVRCYVDLEEGSFKNFVLVASDLTGFEHVNVSADVGAVRMPVDQLQQKVLAFLASPAAEVPLGHLTGQRCIDNEGAGWAYISRMVKVEVLRQAVALDHWRVMRGLLGNAIWAM